MLPITKEEMYDRGWHYADVVIVTGDAYVDHSSFGTAIISRVLEHAGYKVCIVAQPQNDEDYMEFGRPRYAFLVNSGNIDSMVAHYTVAKKKRSEDAYSPGGKMGLRPDRALTVYSKNIKRLYPDSFIAVGGLEASFRRFAHYDYWSESVRPSVLLESGADLLMFGMGELVVTELINRLKRKEDVTDIRGTCVISEDAPKDYIRVPSYESVSQKTDESRRLYALAAKTEQEEQDDVRGRGIAQRHGDVYLIQNPPMRPLNQQELDEVYALPYERRWHPKYDEMGGVPGLAEVKFSITHNRGCFGGCNFCSLSFHQGRAVTARSERSVIEEAKLLTQMEDFKGYIHDIGGPTANFRQPSCKRQKECGLCKNRKCLAPEPCRNLDADHSEYLSLLRKVRALPGVKKVFIRSGIRYDYMMQDKNDDFFKEMVRYHISGQLRVAPEHCSQGVLNAMGKPSIEVYEAFKEKFNKFNKETGLKQFIVPYLMSSHPGSTMEDAIELALFLKKEGLHPDQVQDFYPTPGTVSTCMFYTGINPETMEPIYVPRSQKEKSRQRAMLQYYRPENHALVKAALLECGREDLIGYSKECLIGYRPYKKAEDRKSDNGNTRDGKKGPVKDARKPGKSNTDRGPQKKTNNPRGTDRKNSADSRDRNSRDRNTRDRNTRDRKNSGRKR